MSQDSSGAQGEPRDPYEPGRSPSSDPYQQQPTQPVPDPYQQGGTPPYEPAPSPYEGGEPASPYQSPSSQPYGSQPYGSQPYQAPGSQPYGSQPYGSQPYGAQPYPATPYGPGAYGQPPSAGTDGFAIAALVTGILTMAVVPIVLGIIALSRIKRSGQSGKGMAIAGIVLGALSVIGWVVVTVLFVAVLQSGVIEDIQNDPRFTAPPYDTSVQEYGDSPALDALYDSCEAGDDEACHDLFLESPSGSEYETFGSTCGGRQIVCLPF